MKIVKRIISTLFLLLLFHAVSPTLKAQEITEPKDTTEYELTLPVYPEWEKASISGKLKMKGLPLSPGIKIFMEKDSSIFITIRAPFMGEVGRLEITGDSLLAINKMKKTYVQEPLQDFLRYFPGTLEDIQTLILGRIVIPGYGELNETTADFLDLLVNGEDFYLIPIEEVAIAGFDYGYMISEDFLPLALMVVPEENPDIVVTLSYGYQKDSYEFNLNFEEGSRAFDVKLELDEPQWNGEIPKPVKIDGKYRRLSLTDFVRSF